MKKVHIAIVLLLATMLISGFSCSGDSGDITSCNLNICGLCGHYVSQADSSHSIEILSDGTAYLYERGTQISGIWRYDQVELKIKWQGHPDTTRWQVGIDTIRDDDGIVWVKQAVDTTNSGTSAPPF